MKVTDARITYIQDTFPYKDSFGTIELYELNGQEGLRISLTYPAKEGDKHKQVKHYEVNNDRNR